MADIIRGLIVLFKGAAIIIAIGVGLWLLYVGVFVGIPFLFAGGVVWCVNACHEHIGVILIVVVLLIAKAVGKASRE